MWNWVFCLGICENYSEINLRKVMAFCQQIICVRSHRVIVLHNIYLGRVWLFVHTILFKKTRKSFWIRLNGNLFFMKTKGPGKLILQIVSSNLSISDSTEKNKSLVCTTFYRSWLKNCLSFITTMFKLSAILTLLFQCYQICSDRNSVSCEINLLETF